MRLMIAASFAVFLIGCSTPAPARETPFDLTVSPPSPEPGGEVTLTLVNNTVQQIGYNLCTSTLERETGSGWEPVPSDRVCTMELRTLGPGMTDSFTLTLPPALPDGVYRFQANVENLAEGTRRDVATAVFLVSS